MVSYRFRETGKEWDVLNKLGQQFDVIFRPVERRQIQDCLMKGSEGRQEGIFGFSFHDSCVQQSARQVV